MYITRMCRAWWRKTESAWSRPPWWVQGSKVGAGAEVEAIAIASALVPSLSRRPETGVDPEGAAMPRVTLISSKTIRSSGAEGEELGSVEARSARRLT